tara:strand:- start:10 stop:618 length:609 start_codon:yes stop_codon:yes gene_type:complete
MAKGTNDIILRDRLQFDIDANGTTDLVYGRIDLSDYVSIPEAKGLAIKEVRFQLRTRVLNGVWPNYMSATDAASFGTSPDFRAEVKLFATTTAYENVTDVGIGSPNVLCVFDKQSSLIGTGPAPGQATALVWDTYEKMHGTPDLHPEGYDVVTDLLIGIAALGCSHPNLAGTTAEIDVMLICEKKKITSKDLTQMLSQAQDV